MSSSNDTATLTIGAIIAGFLGGILHMVLWGIFVGIGFAIAHDIYTKIKRASKNKEMEVAWKKIIEDEEKEKEKTNE